MLACFENKCWLAVVTRGQHSGNRRASDWRGLLASAINMPWRGSPHSPSLCYGGVLLRDDHILQCCRDKSDTSFVISLLNSVKWMDFICFFPMSFTMVISQCSKCKPVYDCEFHTRMRWCHCMCVLSCSFRQGATIFNFFLGGGGGGVSKLSYNWEILAPKEILLPRMILPAQRINHDYFIMLGKYVKILRLSQ